MCARSLQITNERITKLHGRWHMKYRYNMIQGKREDTREHTPASEGKYKKHTHKKTPESKKINRTQNTFKYTEHEDQ